MSKNDTNPNGEDVNNVSDAREVLDKTLGNLSVEADSETVGAGYRIKHMNRADDAAIQKAKKEKNKSKSHNALIKQLQDRINDLQSQIDVLQGKIDELNEKIDKNKEKIAKYDEQLAKLKEGSPQWLAVLALKNASISENEDFIDLRDDFQDRQDGLAQEQRDLRVRYEELNGDKTAQNNLVSELSTATTAFGMNKGEENSLKQAEHNEFSKRMVDGTGEHEIIATVEVKETFSDNFLGDDLFGSAEQLEIADNFAKAASGEIQLPEFEREVTPQDPSQNISLNV